jgi:RNA polymerase sigma factor (sigma-70 family)
MTVEEREQRRAEAMRAERRRDAIAYERMLKEVATALRRSLAARLVRVGLGAHEAEDLVQEILMGLHRKRHSWDPARPFLPWLHTITRYKLIDFMRHRRGDTRRRVDLALEIVESPADEVLTFVFMRKGAPTQGNVSLTLGAHSFAPNIFSRVHIKQFVAIGAILTGAQGLFLHEAVCHESVIMLRRLPFGRTSLGNVPAESQARSLTDEESEDSSGIGRRRTHSNAQWSTASIFAGRNTATAWHSEPSWDAVSKLDKMINLDLQSRR